mmetsp:Transcript_48809/g.139654  ORF Transcript_48809/g.139654 Transcript_48809/m.139654 type:complete len:877 (-) Transcript_48809:58-2688(-)
MLAAMKPRPDLAACLPARPAGTQPVASRAGRAAAGLLLTCLPLLMLPCRSPGPAGAAFAQGPPGAQRPGCGARARGRAWLRAAGVPQRQGDGSQVLESFGAVAGAVTDRKVKAAQQRRASGTWRRESGSWAPAPPVLSNGEVLVQNLKHGPNILTLDDTEFPRYNEIRHEHIERGLDWMTMSSGHDLWALYHDVPISIRAEWENIMHPLEVISDKIERIFATIKHIRNVIDPSPKMQKLWNNVLWLRWRTLLRTRRSENFLPHFKRLLTSEQTSEARRRAVAAQLVLFEQDGVNLQENGIYKDDPGAFLAFIHTRNQLFDLSQDWEMNIANDLAKKSFLVRQREELDGVSDDVFADAAAAAVQAGYPKATPETGPWMVTLDDAMLEPILRQAEGRTFREFVYAARARAAFLGGSGKGDNTPVLAKLLKLRKEYANLIGFSTWADMAFTLKMATMKQAYAFLARLRRESLPAARQELLELQEFAESHGAEYELNHFDVDYWRRRLTEEQLSLHDDYLRQFFPLPHVLDSLFGLLQRLFGVRVAAADGQTQVWDEHVRFYRLHEEETGALLGSFFLDPYRRRGKKRPGFWVDRIQEYSTVLGSERHGPRLPAVHIVCDFQNPGPGQPTLLPHSEVVKLFHVMGGALRHLLSNQTEGIVAGTFGLEADVVELPAFFLERWAHEPAVLRSARHFETGDQLPEAAVVTLAAARTFHGGMRLLKRTSMAQVDLDIHAQYEPDGALRPNDVAKLIEAEFTVIPPRVEDHELCSLPIGGERAASLFVGLWAEALAADCFRAFEEAGLDDEQAVANLGRAFRRTLLEPGGGRSPAGALREFLGRPPSFAAFLRHCGLGAAGGGGLRGTETGPGPDGGAARDAQEG